MPGWGEIFADPAMQSREPEPELIALIPEVKATGCRRVLDAGCGVGRHLLPLHAAGFEVGGVDCDPEVLRLLRTRLNNAGLTGARPYLAQADLKVLPFRSGTFDLAVSIKVINHGDAASFRDYCRELDRVLRPGGRLFIMVSPFEFAEKVKLPQTRELEPGTLVDIATPDGTMVHHFPTPAELREQFPRFKAHRWETVQAPIAFMGNVEMPQLVFWGEKGKQ
ncbi:MAG: class I SAM-dependent methyltransferase [Desulfobaccales bacterium]